MEWFEIYKEYSLLFMKFFEKHDIKSGTILFERYVEKDPGFSEIEWIANIKEYRVDSIDPIHIFASFNYWKIPVKTRKERMILFLNLIQQDVNTLNLIRKIMDSDYLDVFFNFPHLNITNIVASRSIDSQEEIWKLFSFIVQDDEFFDRKIEELFNNYKSWHGIQVPSLTIFLFWVNSDKYLPLDKNTVSLLKKYKVIKVAPTTYDKYVKLLQNRNHKNLFRNLAYMAIDEKKFNTFTDDEKKSINEYLKNSKEEDIRDIEHNIEKQETDGTLEPLLANIEERKEKLIMLDDFNFELYFVINGIPKVIRFISSNIEEFEDLEYDRNVIIQPNFLIIGLKILDDKHTKILKDNKIYYFNKCFMIKERKVTISEQYDLYRDHKVKNININAVVGKNGTGKSTIIELLVKCINNIAKSLINKNPKAIQVFEDFFYTINTNYSLHALNDTEEGNEWLHDLFHKNDAYQIPMVIEPMREKGDIKIIRLNNLVEQRLLSTILEPSIEFDNTELLRYKKASYLNISLNIKKILGIIKKFVPTTAKVDEQNYEQYIDSILEIPSNKKILSFLTTKNIVKNDIVKNDFVEEHRKIAYFYLCYKLKNITENYEDYKDYKGEDKYSSEEYIDLLMGDDSHITFKLKQTINFLNNNTIPYFGDIQIKDLSEKIKKIKKEGTLTVEYIPPSFFNVKIYIKNISPLKEKTYLFDELSSGEKQKIYSIVSIIYHIQNIQSVHNSNNQNNIKYSNINLILDEIELCFHPDMQRTFIFDLLDSLERKEYFNNILGLNIILVTHSPFILSDITKSNIMYLHEDSDYDGEEDIGQTFGANIHTMLDNSFFMEDGLMGKFAKKHIQKLIDSIKIENNQLKDIILKEINIIGEPIIKNKLLEMYYETFSNKLELLEKEKEKILKEIEIEIEKNKLSGSFNG